MNKNTETQMDINAWIIKTRWFFLLLVGTISYWFFPIRSSGPTLYFVLISLLVFSLANIALYLYIKHSNKKIKTKLWFARFGYLQIILEIIFFIFLLFVVPGALPIGMFLIWTILVAAFIAALRGIAIVMGSIILVILINNLAVKATIAFTGLEMIGWLLFYSVIAVIFGWGITVIRQKEKRLAYEVIDLTQIKKIREKDLKRLDQIAKLLVKRDNELTDINQELKKKNTALEQSEKSLFKAFADLKKVRSKAEMESNKIAAIISNFVDPIIMIDRDSRLCLINPAAKNMLGILDSDENKSIRRGNNYSIKNFKTIIKKDFKVKSSKELKTKNTNEEEVVIKNKNKEITYKVITAKVIDNNDKFIGTLKIFYNLTREKMLNKIKSDFITIAAHQLRTPLSAIKWIFKMLIDRDIGELSKDQENFISKGFQGTERMIELINDLLNVSRIEEGRFDYSFSQNNFKEIIDIVINSLENQIRSNHINFKKIVPKRLPDVYMDKEKIIIVLQNLLENSLKYTPEYGTIELRFEVGKKLLTIKVKDNGVGIPIADHNKIFSKFYRADNVMRIQTEGSGLGLYLVKNIIEKHGGDISFSSAEGRGTEFTVTLPFK